MKFSLVVLAAGEGKRMKSDKSKVVFKVCGKEMVNRVIDEAMGAGCENACVIVGHKAEAVREAVGGRAVFVTQTEQLGTGHAVMQAKDFLSSADNVLVLAGDTPLITSKTLKGAMEKHLSDGNSCTVLTARVRDPFGYEGLYAAKTAMF